MISIVRLIIWLFLSPTVAASTVLFIGDSQSVGPFGDELDGLLRKDGHRVASFGACGTTPWQWYDGKNVCGLMARNPDGSRRYDGKAPTPLIEDLLRKHSPDVVIMQFGGNFTGVRDEAYIQSGVRKIVATVLASGARCFWVNNPDKRVGREDLPRVWRLMEEAVGSDCPIMRTQEVIHYPDVDEDGDGRLDGDGRHYNFPAGVPLARAWALATFEEFQRQFPSQLK